MANLLALKNAKKTLEATTDGEDNLSFSDAFSHQIPPIVVNPQSVLVIDPIGYPIQGLLAG
jgi:hypothetical protein